MNRHLPATMCFHLHHLLLRKYLGTVVTGPLGLVPAHAGCATNVRLYLETGAGGYRPFQAPILHI